MFKVANPSRLSSCSSPCPSRSTALRRCGTAAPLAGSTSADSSLSAGTFRSMALVDRTHLCRRSCYSRCAGIAPTTDNTADPANLIRQSCDPSILRSTSCHCEEGGGVEPLPVRIRRFSRPVAVHSAAPSEVPSDGIEPPLPRRARGLQPLCAPCATRVTHQGQLALPPHVP